MADAAIFIKLEALYEQSYRYLKHAPKFERHILVPRILNTELDLICKAKQASRMTYKKKTLFECDTAHAQLRELWHLYDVRGYFRYADGIHDATDAGMALHRSAVIQRLLDEIGAMLGGWIKSVRDKETA